MVNSMLIRFIDEIKSRSFGSTPVSKEKRYVHSVSEVKNKEGIKQNEN